MINAGINVSEGVSFTGREDKYLAAIQRFYHSYDNIKYNLESLRAANDLKNYVILIHALKSNAKTIGADKLSELALNLEIKGKEGDTAYIDENTPVLFEEYDKVIGILKPYGLMTNIKASGEIDGKEALEITDKLLLALEDYDDDTALSLIDKLFDYPFVITRKEQLNKARSYTDDFCYDEAYDIVKELKEWIIANENYS